MGRIGYLLNDLMITVENVADFLENCNENARLRECLIDTNFQLVLAALFRKNISGVLIGRFLSDTGLSIKELQNFSPHGFSLQKIYKLEESAGFISFFINSGLKVGHLGIIGPIAHADGPQQNLEGIEVQL